jgi:hypothetical protein
MMRTGALTVAILGWVCAVVSAQTLDSTAVSQAKTFFEKYQALEREFDPTVADLYSDDAIIKNKRTYPTREVRELAMPAPKYKALIRAAIPLARERGDTNTYSECTYSPEGPRVRIKCQRFSHLKKYTSPLSLLVGPSGDGWFIFEELSESRP